MLLVRVDSFGVKGSPQMTMQIKMDDFAFTFGQRSQKCAFIKLMNGNDQNCDGKKKKNLTCREARKMFKLVLTN